MTNFRFRMHDQVAAAKNSTATSRSALGDGSYASTSCRLLIAEEESAGGKGVTTAGGDGCGVRESPVDVEPVSSGSEARRHRRQKLKGDLPRQPHHFQGGVPSGYPDGAIPAAAPHPPVMYMMPPWAGYRSPVPLCGPIGENGPMGVCGPIGGSVTVRSMHSDIDTTFDSRRSALSLFESPCVKPCEGIGRLIGTTVTAFVDGLRSTLDYGEELCHPQSSSQPSPAAGEAGPSPPLSAVAAPPTGVVADTPHPEEQASERISEKMDELLRLLKEKEAQPPVSGTPAAGSDEGRGALEDDSGEDVRGAGHEVAEAASPTASPVGMSVPKEKADEKTKEAWVENPPSVGGGDTQAPTFRLKEAARKGSLDVDGAVRNLKCLNESAISKDSELLAITQGLEVDLTLDNGNGKRSTGVKAGEEKAGADALASRTTGLSVSGAINLSAEENGGKAGNKTLCRKGRRGRPSRGRAIKSILRDIKNVPRDIKAEGRGSSPVIAKKVGCTAPRATGGGRKKMSSGGVRAVKITVERPIRSDSAARWRKQGQDEGPFLADFSPNTAIDSMGFPSPPLTNKPSTSSSQRKDAGGGAWEGDFSRGDNPFSTGSANAVCSAPGDAATTATGVEKRVCAWCRKGGTGNADISCSLKLCSICRSTYYCSPECQSKDWRKGHALICRPPGSTVTI